MAYIFRLMSEFVIKGKKSLNGEIKVSGSKNAALKIFPVAILAEEKIKVSGLPMIEDVFRSRDLLISLGHEVKEIKKGVFELKSRQLKNIELPRDIVGKFRASIMFVGPMLAAYGEVRFPHPGGCVIGAGTRPINMFLDSFQKMGVKMKIVDDTYHLKVKKLKGAEIFFPRITVTGTESLMMTACLAEGETVLKNCAMEPEITALAAFLNSIGARIEGAGTSIIKVKGVKNLRGGEYQIIPDRIEAGTFAMMAAALPESRVVIKDIYPHHLEALWVIFDKIGVNYSLEKNAVIVGPNKNGLKACDVITHEYPGFATDFQSPYTVLMTQARGSSLIHEVIYDRRLLFTDILTQMGANITMCDPHRIVVMGPTPLYGRQIISPDLRAGVALVIAALVARGETQIGNIYQIDRGYENLDERLKKIGADIKRINN